MLDFSIDSLIEQLEQIEQLQNVKALDPYSAKKKKKEILSQAFHDLREQVKREDIKIVMDTYHGVNNHQVRAGIARAAKKLKGSLSPL